MSFMKPVIEKASAETETPQDDDYYVGSTGPLGGLTRIVQSGRTVFEGVDCDISKVIAADMQDQEYFPNVWIEDDHGGKTLFLINADTGDTITEQTFHGYAWRLSAPGYLDCTEWSHGDTVKDCISDALGLYGDEFDENDLRELGSYLDGFDEFLDGYLIGLAFTASVDNNEGDPLFNNPDGDIMDVVDTDSDLWEKFDDEQKVEILHDCLTFLNDSQEFIGEKYHDAGSDFHLTRNGHGAGFWDGDWEHGDKLTDLSKPYGTKELMAYEESDGFYFYN